MKLHGALEIFLLMVGIAFNADGRCLVDSCDMSAIDGIKLLGNINVVCIVDSINGNTIEYPDTVSDWDRILYIAVSRGSLVIQKSDEYNASPYHRKTPCNPLIVRTYRPMSNFENAYDSTLIVKGIVNAPVLKAKQSGNGSIMINSIDSPEIHLSIITGNGTITVGDIEADELSCKIVGTGAITIEKGKCNFLKCKTVGTGKINLLGRRTENARIFYRGGGYVRINASETITAYGLGTTKIYYIGNPEIKRRGNVKPQKILVEE